MGIFAQPTRTGRDFYTESLIARWFSRAGSLWGTTNDSYNCFGEAQKNPVIANGRITGYIPQWKSAATGEFLDGNGQPTDGGLFIQDNLAVVSFLGFESDTKTVNGSYQSVNARWYFFINLNRITPGGFTTQQQSGQRLTELVMNDVTDFLVSNGNGFTVTGSERDINKVLEWYGGAQKNSAMLDDMNKNGNEQCCFCIKLNLVYNPIVNKTLPVPQ